ncbi:Uncharacterised protein [Klebsiella michiganensis]|uniref:Uncharacterized protein n=1 Tax=Klebsiella michiganensis TaxID=1134687 RepID=A0A7H4PIA2_9ENTR|nr:Uncharacterised protein [Klebsiella michiganensis]
MSTLITDKVDKAAVHNEKTGHQRVFTAHPLAAIFTGLLPVCAVGGWRAT